MISAIRNVLHFTKTYDRLLKLKMLAIMAAGGLGLVVLVLLGQGIWTAQFLQYLDTHFLLNPDSGGTPLHYLVDVKEAVAPYEDVIIIGGDSFNSNAKIWNPMLRGQNECVRELLINDGFIDILPANPYVVMIPPDYTMADDFVIPQRYLHEAPLTVPLRPGEPPYTLYPFEVAPARTQSTITEVEPRLFANHVILTGYNLLPDMVQLRWKLLVTSPLQNYQFFVHFLNEQGERISQLDAPFYSGKYWCENDTIIISNVANLADETVYLRIGLYILEADGGTTEIDVLDASGSPAGQFTVIEFQGE